MLLSLLLRGVGMGGSAQASAPSLGLPHITITTDPLDSDLGDGYALIFRPPWPETETESAAVGQTALLEIDRDPEDTPRSRRVVEVLKQNFNFVSDRISAVESGLADDTGEAIFTSPGVNYWTCPAGVTSVTVVAYGAGGTGESKSTGGRGGGGGEYASGTVAVTAGEVYAVTVASPIDPPTASTFYGDNSEYVEANSGYFGGSSVLGRAGYGGGSSLGSEGHGNILVNAGGRGLHNSASVPVTTGGGGGGGGAGGSSSVGSDGSSTSTSTGGAGGAAGGGAAGAGGAGGDGGEAGEAGSSVGGGGGGSGGGGFAGGAGANGKVTLTWNPDRLPLSEMADLATQRLIGRDTAGTGIPEAITIYQALDWIEDSSHGLLRRNYGGTDASWFVLTTPLREGWVVGAEYDGVGYAPAYQPRGTIILEDQKSSGTAGGTFTSGAWRTRTLNTEVTDTGGMCSLASNQFTLDAGTYEIEASAPAGAVNRHQIRLQNITDTTTDGTGTSEFNAAASAIQTRSHLRVRITIASAKAFEIQHQCETTSATNGFGVPGSFGTEVFTTVFIRRVK